MTTELTTSLGTLKCNDYEEYIEALGVPYATAKRFEYATMIEKWEGTLDATHFGQSCPQTRGYYEHLEVPERLFYHNEFRKNQVFSYGEDCLNCNFYIPKNAKDCPVLVYIYGGGFNSGSNAESPFHGAAYAKRRILTVCINYRVGILGYLTHEEVKDQYGHEGNYGLDDQKTALLFLKKHVSEFGGDPDFMTVMGQSAGAISIQYLCLNPENKGLFRNAIMLSGAGLFPKFSLPRKAETTREYWLDFMKIAGVKTFAQLKDLPLEQIFDAIEAIKAKRKDNTYNTMPVVDGYLIPKPIDELIGNPLDIPYMVGYTNNDMYAILMSIIAHRYAKQTNAYLYYFDIDAPGTDHNGAFHSSDLRYVFGTLKGSHRPYSEWDYQVSETLISYICNFIRTGNPNLSENCIDQSAKPSYSQPLPEWKNKSGRALCINKKSVKMGHPNRFKLFFNTITKGDPT